MKKEELIPITNDMMFTLVMEDKEICRNFLSMLFPDKVIGEIKITTQRSFENGIDTKGIRLDVFVESEKEWYDIEMQCTESQDLSYRSRYYRSVMDIQMIKKGAYYTDLKKSYVIFICTFDPFGYGLPIYTFQNRCEEKNTLPLEDESYIIMINTKGTGDGLSNGMKDFLDYVNRMEIAENDDFVAKVHTRVVHFNESEWRGLIMTWEEKMEERVAYEVKKATAEAAKKSFEEGLEQGREKGIEQNIEMIARKMKDKSMDAQLISELTGLAIAEIDAL